MPGLLLSGRDRRHFDANDLAFDLFAHGRFEFGLVAVDLVLQRGPDDELGGVHGFIGVGAAGVAFAAGVEEEVVDLMLVLFILYSCGLGVLERGVAFELVGGGGNGSED